MKILDTLDFINQFVTTPFSLWIHILAKVFTESSTETNI